MKSVRGDFWNGANKRLESIAFLSAISTRVGKMDWLVIVSRSELERIFVIILESILLRALLILRPKLFFIR